MGGGSLRKAGQGRLGDEGPPSECLGHRQGEQQGQGQQVAVTGGWCTWSEGRAGSRGHPGHGFVGLRVKSGLCFMDTERPLKGTKQKQKSDFCFYKSLWCLDTKLAPGWRKGEVATAAAGGR